MARKTTPKLERRSGQRNSGWGPGRSLVDEYIEMEIRNRKTANVIDGTKIRDQQ